MTENILLVFLLLFASVIIILIIAALRFPYKSKDGRCDTGSKPVSIVVPCKNEAENIPVFIDSIKLLEYPAPFEVIFIDDESDDDTKAIVEKASRESIVSIRLIENRFRKNTRLTGKQQAIDIGINKASYPYIVLTDADMTFSRNWLLSLVKSLDPDIDLAFGHTAILPGRSLFGLLQSFQLSFLFSVAAMFHFCGITGSCMGNNIILRKAAYLDCGGFKSIGYSITEDRALLRHFRQCGKSINIVIPFFPIAYTVPHSSFRPFFQQACRWIRGGFSGGLNLSAAALLLTLQNISLIAATAGLLPEKTFFLTIVNAFLMWIFLFISFKKIKAPVSAFWFPLYLLFLIIETFLLLPALLPNRKILWKGRSI